MPERFHDLRPYRGGLANNLAGLRLEFWVSAGTLGTVGLPMSAESTSLTEDGPLEWMSASKQPNEREGNLYLENLWAGLHSIEISR